MARAPTTVSASIPEEISAPAGSYVFASREPEIANFQFEGVSPSLLADGRLCWIMPKEQGEPLMIHHFIVTQRILLLGET